MPKYSNQAYCYIVVHHPYIFLQNRLQQDFIFEYLEPRYSESRKRRKVSPVSEYDLPCWYFQLFYQTDFQQGVSNLTKPLLSASSSPGSDKVTETIKVCSDRSSCQPGSTSVTINSEIHFRSIASCCQEDSCNHKELDCKEPPQTKVCLFVCFPQTKVPEVDILTPPNFHWGCLLPCVPFYLIWHIQFEQPAGPTLLKMDVLSKINFTWFINPFSQS